MLEVGQASVLIGDGRIGRALLHFYGTWLRLCGLAGLLNRLRHLACLSGAEERGLNLVEVAGLLLLLNRAGARLDL